MRPLLKVPSVIGGVRPHVRDSAQMNFRAVQFLEAEVSKTQEKLASLVKQLKDEEAKLKEHRRHCKKCGECSACIG